MRKGAVSKGIIITIMVVAALLVGTVALSYSLGTSKMGGSKSTTTTSTSTNALPSTSMISETTTSSSNSSSFSALSSSSSTASDKTSTQTVGGLVAKISFGSNLIPRGSTQSIWVEVVDAGGPIPNTTASIKVLDTSGQIVKDFTCTTTTAGDCWTEWSIGSDSTPGIFPVTLTIKGVVFHSSFEVANP